MADDHLDPKADPFHPPEVPTEVHCLHCGKEYESYLIEWRVETGADGKTQGFWCCPTPGCGGLGFGFDILPTDPTYQDERGGWVMDDEEDDEEDEADGEDNSDDESFWEDDPPDWPSDPDPTDSPDDDADEELPW